jgi:hypothetical protein
MVISFGRLGISMEHDERRIDAGLERGQDFTAAGHVEPKPFFHHDALHGCAGERL